MLPSKKFPGTSILYDVLHNLNYQFPPDKIILASDSEEIKSWQNNDASDLCQFIKTHKHFTGSARCVDAARIMGLSDNEWIINFQADECCFPVDKFPAFLDFMENASLAFRDNLVGTFVAPIRAPSDYINPNVVKVVCSFYSQGKGGSAIYFSRSPVPWFTKHYVYSERRQAYQHIGIYYTQVRTLTKFSSDPEIENLEQLQPLMMGVKFYCHLLKIAPLQINTQEDYDAYCRAYATEKI